ncbi:hypothetical protein K504DRAFT_12651 [Pleomassaria siparia CBS 279.74]|uniref:Uncharacterized protein n=1 Tax=Pleomassaria siparia CBS 279.74 TaxID=1314801 RepID=A0A6G1KPV2_9PLEO|nr:hypothetical protein K504DRAFT_12651 [Pleomassaria siparia CBS 279.74]
MNSRPSPNSSPLNSPKPTTSQTTSAQPTASSAGEGLAETPQLATGLLVQFSADSATPPIIITVGSPEPLVTTEQSRVPESSGRGRSLVSRHGRLRNSSSQPPRQFRTPYDRPRFQSQSRDTARTSSSIMSSPSSSPANTTTSGPSGTSTSTSAPGYQLPYAPFPYPMPTNTRGSQGQQRGSGSSK